MPLEPGTKLGPYEILATLPNGVLGEVYKATDSKLNRTVMLRLLPPETVKNPILEQRLEDESRTVTSLNHPHIGAVYEVGRHEDRGYIAAEYVEGETLAQRLSRGPLDLEEALKVAMSIADALDKAHRKGLVHRNLNPYSIVLTADGGKLVDFGLTNPAPANEPAVVTSTASTRTAPGTAMAKPTLLMPYQSPEQIQGKEPDARSDIFSFGAILYEMVTGKPAFDGKTQALLIAAITSIDPEPVSKTQPLAPPDLDYVVKRCLAKSPQKRLQTAWDLFCQLQWIAEGGAVPLAAPRKKRERILFSALALVALLVLILAIPAYLSYRGKPTPPDARFVVPDLGFMVGAGGSSPSISPDGRWLAAGRGPDSPGLDVISLSSVTRQTLLPGTLTYFNSWKPDGSEIVFFDNEQMKRVKVSGGPAQIICDAPSPYGGAAWGSNGVIVFSSAGRIYRVLEVGGERVPVSTLDTSRQETEHLTPHLLPDGRHFLYFAVSSQPQNNAVFVGSLDSPERKLLFATDTTVQYAEPGYLLFNRGDAVFAQAFDADSLLLKGEPVRIADGVPGAPFGSAGNNGPVPRALSANAMFDISQAGVLAYRMGGRARGRSNAPAATSSGQPMSLVWFDRSNRGTAVGPPGTYAGVNLAPDGKRFAVHRHEGDGGDIWLYDPDQGDRMQRWTFDVSQENSMPVWSPDGKRIAFASRRSGKWGIYVKAADNTGTEETIVETNVATAPMSWTSTGQLVYWVEDPKTSSDIYAVPMTGEHKPVPIVKTDAEERFPQVSADGKWIAYQAPDAMGSMQIWVNSFPRGQGPGWQVTNEGGIWPRWRNDGKELELYFYQPPTFYAVSLRVVGSAIQPGVPRLLFGANNPNLIASSHYSLGPSYYRYAVSPDGQRFLVAQPAVDAPQGATAPRGGRGTLADGITAAVDSGRGSANGPQPVPNEIAIVLNWTRLLKPK